jgi:hypothetical protein
MFDTQVVEEIKTRFIFSNFSPPENRAVYEITWKNVDPDRSQLAL